MFIIKIILGVAVLTLGRKLYWLFVGVAGFALGLSLAALLLRGQPELLVIIVALLAGLVGAVLAKFLQRVAVFLAGFFAGGYITFSLMRALSLHFGEAAWILYLLGGIIAAVFVAALFDWALIILSSLTGAAFLMEAIHVNRMLILPMFIVLLLAGIIVQGSMLWRDRRRAAS